MTPSKSCLKSFWRSLSDFSSTASDTCSTSSSALVSSIVTSSKASVESTAASLNWMVENRGGLAKLAGLMMVPSQFIGLGYEDSRKVIDNAIQVNEAKSANRAYSSIAIEKISLPLGDHTLGGIICYPKGWNPQDRSRCVLYHNPNGITTAGYFEDHNLSWTPGMIMAKEKVPMILYDYRGTGLSKNNSEVFSSIECEFHPTYATIAEDGVEALKFALNNFQKVDVWGSSLGGGVATISLDRYLQRVPHVRDSVTLHNHDSFSTTSRVVMPSLGRAADIFGSVAGGNLDAASSMKNLIDRKVKVTVLCHRNDPVIPAGARMAEFMENKPDDGIFLIYSELYGHANLSDDMIRQVWKS